MLWKFVCRWRKIWGLMSFVGLIRRWYLTVALYTFYRFCARWRPWFCAFLIISGQDCDCCRFQGTVCRNGRVPAFSVTFLCIFCKLLYPSCRFSHQMSVVELNFSAEIFRPLEEHLWVWIWFLEYSFWVSNGHLLQMATEKILPAEWSLNSPSSCNFLMVSVVSG